jgi:pyrroloquinoline quinone biosynthesis protein D
VKEAAVPRLARGMKLREDKARGQWVVLGPERMFVPDEVALEVLRLLDGVRNVAEMVDDLAGRYDAPRDLILADVTALLEDLAAKGVVTT